MRAEGPDDVYVVEAAPERPPRAKPGAENAAQAPQAAVVGERDHLRAGREQRLLVRSLVALDDPREHREALEVAGDTGDEAEEGRVGGIGRQPSVRQQAERAVLVDAEPGELCHFLSFSVHLHIPSLQ